MRRGTSTLELAVHHESVDEAELWMEEGAGQAADNGEAEALPEVKGRLVGADNKIELHGAKAAGFRVFERVAAHGTGDAAADSPGRGHVAAVGHVRAGALLVGVEEVGAENFLVVFGDEDMVARSVPVSESLLASEVARQGVGFAGANGGFENFPDSIVIG